jgi:probable F420-dependent oxidoreductase
MLPDVTPPMKYALYALHRGENARPDRLAATARRVEEVGFESLWVGDHIALPDDAPDSSTEPRLEALITLTYLAAVTERIRLGVGVLVLPQRQPVLLAKQLTSLDVLSGGRLDVGIGVGYVEAELAAFGVALADRAAMTDEYIEVLLKLWRHDRHHDGRFVTLRGVVQHPGPVQRPRPPLVVGGHAAAALERAASVGDGWFGWELTPERAGETIARLDRARRRVQGAERTRLEITVTPPDPFVTPDEVRRYAEAGVDRLVLVPGSMTAAGTDAVIDHAATHLLDTGDR